jgi:hypothetical protein
MAGPSHSGKIHPGKPVGGTQFGTTFCNSDTHAPELRKGSNTMPKGKIGVNGIIDGSPHGATFNNAGKQPFDSPKPSTKGGESKVVKSGPAEGYLPGKGAPAAGSTPGTPTVKNPPVKKR